MAPGQTVPLSAWCFLRVKAIGLREVESQGMSSQIRVTPDRAVLAGMLVTAGVYCRDLQYDFILDDVPLILTNETITSWKNWTALFVSHIGATQGVDINAALYRPIYISWFMVNYQLFGMVLPWWHLTSLLLHLLVTFLVYKVGRLFPVPGARRLPLVLGSIRACGRFGDAVEGDSGCLPIGAGRVRDPA